MQMCNAVSWKDEKKREFTACPKQATTWMVTKTGDMWVRYHLCASHGAIQK